MLLQELVKGLEVDNIRGELGLHIDNVVYDSREVSKNSLFICIEGFKTDGHLYIQNAIMNGAVAIIAEKSICLEGVTVISVKDTRKAMATIANHYYNHPSHDLKLIGITGTNGKTTTTYMVRNIIETSGKKTAVIGTISNWIGNKEFKTERTTPESLDIQKTLRKALDKSIEYCIMEVSSHSLELQRVEECDFSIGTFTNLSPEHLDFHGNIVNYRNAKKKLFNKTNLCNIINLDDEDGKIIIREIQNSTTPLLTYGTDEKADIKAQNIIMTIKEITFDLITPDYRGAIKVKIPGKFTVYNALAAIAITYALGIDFKHIKEGLLAMEGVAGRLETIKEFEDFSVIVDYAHTPAALENLLQSVREFVQNKVITVFGCGGDRDKSKRPLMGCISGRYSDLTIITSDNPRTENPASILAMVEEGIKKTDARYLVIKDRRKAIGLALKNAQKGDIVVIAGKGHETYQIINNDTLEFDDKKVALEIAREEGILC